jgi:hypothetical protein
MELQPIWQLLDFYEWIFFYFMGVKPYERKYRLKKKSPLHDTTNANIETTKFM